MRVAMAVLFEFTAAVLLALTTLVTGNHFSECQTFQGERIYRATPMHSGYIEHQKLLFSRFSKCMAVAVL